MQRMGHQTAMMRGIMRTILTALLLAVGSPALAAPHAPVLTESEQATVGKGDIAMRDDPADSDAMYAFMSITAPPEKIFAALNNPELIASSSSSITGCTPYEDVTEEGVRKIKLHYTLQVAWSEVTYYIAREHHVAEGYLSWTLDPNKQADIVQADGFYVLKPQDDGSTLLVYWAKTISGRKVPGWIRDMLTGRALKGWLEAVKKESEA